MGNLNELINRAFPGVVVRKDLVSDVKGSAVVPTYVMEYLLAQYAATDDEETIAAGKEDVRQILANHYVNPADAELVRSRIREQGRYKIIDKVTVRLNDKEDIYEAEFQNLRLGGVPIDSHTVVSNKKLLVGGVWCISDLEYEPSGDPKLTPWRLDQLKPIQMSHFNMTDYLAGRAKFDEAQWLDVLLQSVGLNPDLFGRRDKLLQLTRLVPFVERNYNLVELGPKGTGKSHIYSEFSPHAMLISGGEVTVAKLFINNASGQIGLVGYWDVVAFDEFAGKEKRVNKNLVDIMKNYMANRSFSRGTKTQTAQASMVFVGNTSHTVPYLLKHADLFVDLPDAYHDPAFLDRIHFYLPGWEMDPIRGEMFTTGYGFVVDYLAEVFKDLRMQDFSDKYQQYFTLDEGISTRDRAAIHKTFSGLMKLVYPNGAATREQMEELLRFSMEGRKRVKDQLVRIDTTMDAVQFLYVNELGDKTRVRTLEEDEYPAYYYRPAAGDVDDEVAAPTSDYTLDPDLDPRDGPALAQNGGPALGHDNGRSDGPALALAHNKTAGAPEEAAMFEGYVDFSENQKGVSYQSLFGPWLKGAKEITVTDPYIRVFYQARNLLEFIEMLIEMKDPADDLRVLLVTGENDEDQEGKPRQLSFLTQVRKAAALAGVHFDVRFEEGLHDRSIVADNGWRINPGRGLDIYQRYEADALSLTGRMQQFRPVKAFGVTYLRED